MMNRIIIILSLILILSGISPVFAQKEEPAPLPPPAASASDGNAASEQDKVPMTSIHDIKPPEEAGFDSGILWYVLAVLIVLAVLTALFFLWKHRRRRIKHKTFPSLLPDEAALIALDELLDVENIDGKFFYFRVSAILRHYIQGRYNINAPEMTTEELLPKMDTMGLDRNLVQSLKKLFHTADPIKFADVHSVADKMEKDLAFCRKFVKETQAAEAENYKNA